MALSTAKRIMLGVKLKMPRGVKLDGQEADYVIGNWEKEKKAVSLRQSSLESSAEDIDRHLATVGQDIPKAIEGVREARQRFKQVKSPLAKEKWARKLVVRSRYHKELRRSKQSLEATVERVRDVVDDAQVVYKLLENRIKEARIYQELNGGLHLVGKALIEARKKHQMVDVELQNVEVSMEAIEDEVAGQDRQGLIDSADSIAKQFKDKK